jgi:hypothetical protein
VSLQDAVSNCVVIGLPIFAVLKPIDLNDNAASVANEVQVVALERRLSANVEATLAQSLKPTPKDDLRLAHGAAHLPSAMVFGLHGP